MKARDDGISGRFGKRYRGDAESAKAAIQRVGHAVSKMDDSHCGILVFGQFALCPARESKRRLMQCDSAEDDLPHRLSVSCSCLGL